MMKMIAAVRRFAGLTLSGALLALAAASTDAAAQNYYVGEVITVAFTFCPRDFLPTNGQTLPISQYQALFALIGTRYGGNGQSTFGLPALRPPLDAQPPVDGFPRSLINCIAINGIFPSRP